MADVSAGVAALSAHVERWQDTLPDGVAVVLNLRAAVEAVLSAAQPEALVPPKYDPVLGSDTWHRLADPRASQAGIEVCFRPAAHGPSCEIWLRDDHGRPRRTSLVSGTSLTQLALSACSVAQHQDREGA